jgi:hypothetical protein
MKHKYFLAGLLYVIIAFPQQSEGFAQSDVHAAPEESRPYKLKNEGNESGYNLDSIIRYDFISETDSLFLNRTLFTYDSNLNLTSDIRFLWDDDKKTWFRDFKTEFGYDANGRMILKAGFGWDEDKWIGSYKQEYQFSSSGNIILNAYYAWDDVNDDWSGATKQESTFDASGNLSEVTDYYWDTSSRDWVRDFKYTYAHDAYGSLIICHAFTWDSGNEAWVERLREKTETEFDNSGNRTAAITFWFDGENHVWIESAKTEYRYNTTGKMTSLYIYEWKNGHWVENVKYEYEYDEHGNRTLSIQLNWEQHYQRWVGAKYIYQYDGDGNMTLNMGFSWDDVNETWVESVKHEYEFDPGRNETIFTFYYWDKVNELWISSVRSLIRRHENGKITLLIAYEWDNGNEAWNEKTRGEYVYDSYENPHVVILTTHFGNQVQVVKDYYYWSDPSKSGVEKITAPKIFIYPNPALNELYVADAGINSRITIYDLSGKQVLTLIANSETERIDVSHLKPGIYIITVGHQGNRRVSRFVKQ